MRLVGVVAGSELGVEAADLLSEALSLPSNGSGALSEARRDKCKMQDRVGAAGLRSVRHARAECWGDVLGFLDWVEMPLVVLKPLRSAGSDSIFKCRDEAQARRAFEAIIHKPNALGGVNEAVVVQEFLQGTEYIVDTVSRDGQHKVTQKQRALQQIELTSSSSRRGPELTVSPSFRPVCLRCTGHRDLGVRQAFVLRFRFHLFWPA